MKISINRDVLADAVAWTAHALPHRPQIPVLAGLLLDADANGLTVSAFDYDTSRRATISADVFHPGRILLPGRVLADVVKALPKQPVDLVNNGSEVVLTCGSTEFGLRTLPADDYPTLPAPPNPTGVIDTETLAAAVAHVAPATSNDTAVPMLTGIRIDADGNQLTLAATDRYRIAARTLNWAPTEPGTTAGVVIRGRALHDIAKSLPTGPVTIGLGNGIAALWGAGRTTTIRLLDEQFIDYRARLGLDDWTIWADVDAAPLAAAVKRVALVAERNTAVRLSFSRGQVLIQAGGGDLGRGTEVLDAESSGGDIQIAFQSQFLLDGLAGVDGGRARIGMTEPTKPALIVGPGDDPYRYLVMSLRLA